MASPVIDNKRPHEDIAATMSEANQELARRLGLAATQLRANRDQFALYERNHREKNTADGIIKADTNQAIVKANDAVLSEILAK